MISVVGLISHIGLCAQTADLRLEGRFECADSTYCVNIQVKPQNQAFQIGNSSIYLTYEPQVLTFNTYQSIYWDEQTECENNNSYPWYPHSFDATSTPGQLNITISLDPDFDQVCAPLEPNNWKTIGTICFDVTTTQFQPDIQFSTQPTPQGLSATAFNTLPSNNGTQLTKSGDFQGVAAEVFNCQQTTILGTVTLQGRKRHNATIQMALYDPKTTDEALHQYNTQSNVQGKFTVSDVELGEYAISIHVEKCLTRVANANLSRGNNPIVFPQLQTGDANQDNVINIEDFTILLSSYNQSPQSTNYDTRADFNEDGVVNLFDFSLMLTNYNRKGEVP